MTENVLDTNNNKIDFHVYRIAREPDISGVRGKASYWRDGVLMPAGTDVIGLEQLNEMVCSFGDQSSGMHSMSGRVAIDYMRMDTTGAYAPVPEVDLPGDANGDGMVNVEDAATLAANWQRTGDALWEHGDFNGDNNVDDTDATILAANWQTGAAASVPEPTTFIGLLVIGLALLASRRKR